MKQRTGVVYGLLDPREPRTLASIRYVGSSWEPIRRLRGHIRQARLGDSRLVYRWVRSLLADGVEPVYIELARDTDHQALSALELSFILDLRPQLLNAIIRGRTPPWTAETRAKVSRTARTRVVTDDDRRRWSAAATLREQRKRESGYTVRPETRQKLSEAARGRKPSAETRARLSAALRGRPISDEWRAKLAAAPGHRGAETRAKISAAAKERPLRRRMLALSFANDSDFEEIST